MKQCKTCNKFKEQIEFRFYKRPTNSFYSNKCRRCLADEKKAWVKENFETDNARNKAYNKKNAERIRGMKLVTNYWPKLTWQEAIAEWNRLHLLQNKTCAMCCQSYSKLHVDHCHATGAVRGLLCYNCNSGLGRLKDDVAVLQRAIDYLNNSRKKLKSA